MTERDYILVGGGHNALIAAANLAEHGLEVEVFERNPEAGGALRSSEVLGPGIVADLYATNLNLFLGNPGYQKWAPLLAERGFAVAPSSAPYCNVFPDGKALTVYADTERTRSGLREHSPADLAGFDELYAQFKKFMVAFAPLYGTPMPTPQTFKVLLDGVRAVGVSDFLELTRIVLSSTRELGDQFFETPEAKALMATWGLHLDYGPDISAGAMFPFMEAFADMEAGMTLTRGGAQNLVSALVGLVEHFGGRVTTGTEVTRVLTRGKRAVGVRLADGREIAARKGVIAGVGPNALYNGLLADSTAVPEQTRTKARRFVYGPATMMIHLALDAPVPWAAGEHLQEFTYVHIGPYADDMARTYTQAVGGILPDSPTLIVGQPTATDPTRAPAGTHVLWIQVRALPFEPTSDALGEITPGSWDDMKDAYADRVIAKIEQYAPGFTDTITNRVVLSPADLAAANPNLVRGDSIGGSHHVMQMFLFRPWLGASTYNTPVEGLHHIGAATWPGGGLNGLSGWHCSQALLAGGVTDRIGRLGDRALGWAKQVVGRR